MPERLAEAGVWHKFGWGVVQREAEAQARELAEEAAAEAAAIAAADAEVQRMSMNVATEATGSDAAAEAPPALLVSGSVPADGESAAEDAAGEGTDEGRAEGEQEAAVVEVPPVEPEPYTAAEVQARVAAAVKGAAVAPRSTALALMMLCMDRGWSGRTGDVVRSVFQVFPEHDWLAATLPAEAHPPDALAAFDCLAPLPWSPFPAKLYLLHRCAHTRVL